MRTLLLIILLSPLVGLFSADGEDDGRRGNELYANEQYDLAAQAYREGLAALGADASEQLRYALENNLGAALLKAGNAAEAGEAFRRALESAPTVADAARTFYNAGNAAFEAGDLQQAVADFRESLLRDPDNEDAKFNYEFAKRRLQEQQQQQQQQQRQGDRDEENQEQNQGGNEQQDQEGERDEQQQDSQDQQQGDENRPGEQNPSEDEQRSGDSESQPADPTDLSREQAERILQAMENDEQQLLREVQRMDARPRKVEKDW